jgi:hypothetical protein
MLSSQSVSRLLRSASWLPRSRPDQRCHCVPYWLLRVARSAGPPQGRFNLAKNEDDDLTVVPIPGEENEEERQRIRRSNDRDQELERQGKQSRHNRGYDEAADGPSPPPEIERIVDE